MIKYAPIATKHNNRYRGPFESIKDIAFESDITYNIQFLKDKYKQFDSELKSINNLVKSNTGLYNEIRANISSLKNNIDNNIKLIDKI